MPFGARFQNNGDREGCFAIIVSKCKAVTVYQKEIQISHSIGSQENLPSIYQSRRRSSVVVKSVLCLRN